MKIALTLIVTLVVSTVCFAQQTADPSQDPSAVGSAFFKSLLDEDGATLGKLIAPDFSITSLDGNTVDGDTGSGVGGGFVVVETSTVSDTQTRQYNNDAAVMTGSWKAKGTVQSQAFEPNVKFSVVMAKQTNAWKIVNVQFTPMRQ